MIIETEKGILEFNGGLPLEGSDCPTDWDKAKEWEDKANTEVQELIDDGYSVPKWSWDCGFKLDYDGQLVGVLGRFYPPKTGYGPGWDGTIDVYVMGDKIETKKFECNKLDELRVEVERYVLDVRSRLTFTLQ